MNFFNRAFKTTPFIVFSAIGLIVLGACVDTNTPPQTPETSRATKLLGAFEGCLNRDRSMRTAFKGFDANGFVYREPFGSTVSSRSTSKAQVRVPSNLPTPERSDKSWDTRLLGCNMSTIGLHAPLIYPDILASLKRMGFKPNISLPKTYHAELTSVSFKVVRDGIEYGVKIAQAKAPNVKNPLRSRVHYVRDNAKTFLSITSLTEPPGWSLP